MNLKLTCACGATLEGYAPTGYSSALEFQARDWRAMHASCSADRARPAVSGGAQTASDDTARIDLIQAWLDDFGFERIDGDTLSPRVRLDWFVGDGGGHFETEGATWREAIDKLRVQIGELSAPAATPGETPDDR